MKQFFLILTFLVLSLECVAQEKEFNEAIAHGRSPKQFYCVYNPKKKSLIEAEFENYALKHNYIIGHSRSFTKDRFGEKVRALSEFAFMPKDEYPKFAWEHVNSSYPYSSLKEGTCLIYTNSRFNNFKVLWTGSVENGKLNGKGTVFFFNDRKDSFFYSNGEFRQGTPYGSFVLYASKGTENMDFVKITEFQVGDFSDGMASFRISGNYGFITSDGNIAIQPTYERVIKNFSNGRAEVFADGKERIIGKNGNFIDYTDHQKALDQAAADKKRREELAKQAREDSIKAEQRRQEMLAQQKAEAEKRAAAEKEAEFQRKIDNNKNTKLWTRGCRLCYRFPNSQNFVIATLEEWNEDRSKVKVKIVASPGYGWQLNGDVLEKNNTLWVSARNEGWHLALDEEVSMAIKNDGSVKRETPSTPTVVVPEDHNCRKCNGRGTVVCFSCNGTGNRGRIYDYETCRWCNGKGSYRCYDCNGTGRR